MTHETLATLALALVALRAVEGLVIQEGAKTRAEIRAAGAGS